MIWVHITLWEPLPQPSPLIWGMREQNSPSPHCHVLTCVRGERMLLLTVGFKECTGGIWHLWANVRFLHRTAAWYLAQVEEEMNTQWLLQVYASVWEMGLAGVRPDPAIWKVRCSLLLDYSLDSGHLYSSNSVPSSCVILDVLFDTCVSECSGIVWLF